MPRIRAAPRSRRRAVAAGLGLVLLGALLGLVVGLHTSTTIEIAGSDVVLRIVPGQSYDQLDVAGALTGKRATSRAVLGEPLGVSATFELDASYLFRPDGSFNSDVLPAYVQAFSDPEQVVADIRETLLGHLIGYVAVGAGIGAAAGLGRGGYRRWRAGYDRTHRPDARAVARAYRAPERTVARRIVGALVVAALLDAIPGAVRSVSDVAHLHPSPILADTPLAGTELDGLLQPAIAAAGSYVRTYFAQTDTYYDRLRTNLRSYLAANPVRLPDGPDVEHFGFVTDRHCNIGMDRVVVELMKQFDVRTLVSAGDDDFSGSFGFESACTKNLADKTRQAGITDVFAAGNHDSAATLADERDQGIEVLDDQPITIGGLQFLGDPDPRASRYGQGIRPSSDAAQHRLLDAQGARIGKLACALTRKSIIVLHDPRAGSRALHTGCGRAVLALDGHTHLQAGPDPVPLPDGSTGSQFVGGSTGGAPNEHSVERSFASSLTVGPLQHDAFVNLISYDTATDRLAGVTVFRFTADQQIFVSDLRG